MGAADRTRELKVIADLLEHLRRKRFTWAEYSDIFEAIRSLLEGVQEDVEESADNLEDSFPDRADSLREKYEWIEEATGIAEEAANSFTEEDVKDESFDETAERAEEITDQLEGAIEEIPAPHKFLPEIKELVTFTSKGEGKKPQPQKEDKGKAVWDYIFKFKGGTFTQTNLEKARRARLINDDEANDAQAYIVQLIDGGAGNLNEWEAYLGYEMTFADIIRFVERKVMTVQQADRWRSILKQSREARS